MLGVLAQRCDALEYVDDGMRGLSMFGGGTADDGGEGSVVDDWSENHMNLFLIIGISVGAVTGDLLSARPLARFLGKLSPSSALVLLE